MTSSRSLLAALCVLAGCTESITPRTEPADVPPVTDAPVATDAASPDTAPGEDRPLPQDAPTPSDRAAPEDVGVDVSPPTDAMSPADAPAGDAGGPPVDRETAGPNAVGLWVGAVPGTMGNARVFYPTTPGSERYPLVAFAHGFQLNTANYDLLLRHIASHGYVVASIDYPNSLFSFDHRSVPAALTAARVAFGASTVAGFPAAMRVDASRAVAMGHSAGGKGAVMAVLDDPGFVAALALDPVDDDPSPGGSPSAQRPSIAPERMSMLRRPLGVFGSSLGRCAGFGGACAPEASNWLQFVVSAPMDAPHPFWVPNNFGHNDFLDPGCFGACSLCTAGAGNIDPQRRAVRAISVAFLDRYARNDLGAQPLLDGSARAAYVTAATLWNGTLGGMSRCP